MQLDAGRTPERQALLEKLAALETYLDAVAAGTAGSDARAGFAKHAARHAFRGELTEAQLATLKTMAPATLFRKLAARAVVLPFLSFAAYASGRTLAETRSLPGIHFARTSLAHGFTKLAATPACPELEELCTPGEMLDGTELGSGDLIDKTLAQVTRDFSTQPAHVKNRVIFHTANPDEGDCAPVEKAAAHSADTALLARAYTAYQLSALHAIQSYSEAESSDARNILVLSNNRSQL